MRASTDTKILSVTYVLQSTKLKEEQNSHSSLTGLTFFPFPKSNLSNFGECLVCKWKIPRGCHLDFTVATRLQTQPESFEDCLIAHAITSMADLEQ